MQLTTINRRSFLRLTGLAAVALPVLAACGAGGGSAASTAAAPAGSAAASPNSAPAPGSAKPAAGATLKLPTYIPAKGPTPDLSGDDKIDAGYFAFPKNLVKTVPEPPLKGGEVNVMTWSISAPIAPLDQNVGWQEINKQVGAKINLVNNVSNADYRPKLTTVVAGGELPDTMYIPASPGGQSAPFAQFPDFLEKSAADLTPYLAGDAIKEFPNLAAIPTKAWQSVVYRNKIFGVPVAFPLVPGTVLWVHQETLDQAGLARPKTADDFKKILQALKKPDSGTYGIGASVQGAENTSGAFDLGLYAMIFGAPNNWKADSNGKLARAFEFDQYKAAVGFARDLVAGGLYHPDSVTYNQVNVRTNFAARKFAFLNSGWLAAAAQYWAASQAQNPPGKLDVVVPFGADGGKGSFYTGTQLFGWSMVKKAPEARVKDMLRMFNYFAAPYGSEEFLTINYGVKGVDYNFDDQGNPVPTAKGKSDAPASTPWGYVVAPSQVYYNAQNPKAYATMMQAADKAMVAVGVEDPAATLYSETHSAKGSIVNGDFLLAVGDIIAGRRPLTDYDGLLKDWKAKGGDTIRTEFEQALAASKG